MVSLFKQSCAQVAAQNLFIEAGGPGILFSVNYDTRFTAKRDGLGARLGFGYFGSAGDGILTIPVQLNFLEGSNGNYFESGFGATYVKFVTSNNNSFFSNASGILGMGTFGYRYQSITSGVNFRASYNPVFTSDGFFPLWFGLSVGYTIK